MPAVGDVPEAELEVPETDQSLFRKRVHQLSADGAVDDVVGLFRVVEQERQIERCEFLSDPDEQTGVEDGQVNRPALQGRDRRQITAKLSAWKDADLDLPAALALDKFGELSSALALRMLKEFCCA